MLMAIFEGKEANTPVSCLKPPPPCRKHPVHVRNKMTTRDSARTSRDMPVVSVPRREYPKESMKKARNRPTSKLNERKIFERKWKKEQVEGGYMMKEREGWEEMTKRREEVGDTGLLR